MLTEKEKKNLARLEEDMSIPKWKYILFYGLPFGILLAIITQVIALVFGDISFPEIFNKQFWVNLAMAPVAGLFYGLLMHWLYHREYKRLKQKELSS